MEKIINNPGLQHLAEKVFWNLDVEDLKICAQINQSCKQILQNPIFCLRKFEHLSKENRKNWINVVQSVKNSDKGIAIISYLKWNFKKKVMDIPSYSEPMVQDEFRKKIWTICKKMKSSDEDLETVIILAPLTDNPNAPGEDGRTPIYLAAWGGHTEIVQFLAPLTDNPNTPAPGQKTTPIYWAAVHKYTEIVKILAPLTDNPNAPDKDGNTPILEAARKGCIEIVKILAPLTDNPNAPDKDGNTPLYWAQKTGNWGIVKILKSFK